jgi:hypothetical protein
MTDHDYIRAHLLQEICDIKPLGHISLEEIEANRKQFETFIELMNARMRQGYFRYGRNEPTEPAKIDYLNHIKKCIEAYERTGNQERLVDASNSCRLEFLFPSLKKVHFLSNDDGFHAEIFK